MSRGIEDTRAELARELRQLYGLGASFFRAAAARSGATVTDLQVIDLLEGAGPLTAGQIADLTGLTTGAVTGLLNRLEEAGRVRRERDPADGRRVIVRLVPGDDGTAVGALLAPLGMAWDSLAAQYDDEKIALLLAFLQRGNALLKTEILRLREEPASEAGVFSAPLGAVESGRLVVSCGGSRLALRADEGLDALYRARFEGPAPEVKAEGGQVSISYPRRLWGLGGQRGAEVALSAAIPWRILIRGKAAEISATLDRLRLAELEIDGAFSHLKLALPVPSGVVPLRIGGAASDVTVRRPTGVAARVHLKGWAAGLTFDDQTFDYAGNDVRLLSHGYDGTGPCYDIEVKGAVSMIRITAE